MSLITQKSYDGKASLYLIPTPIGNLDDITVRALNILKSVDIILCEDTRETGKLLKLYNINNKKLISCHEYNQEKVASEAVSLLDSGKSIGLVTDQGTPIISDPGFDVVSIVIEHGYNVISLPGPTAFVPALINSGINPSPFLFYGFLNSKASKRRKELENLKKLSYTLIFYESPHRLSETLKDMLEILGNRDICLQREISKIHEEVIRNKISEIINIVDELKGEFVIIVDGNHETTNYEDLSITEHVDLYIKDGMSTNDAIKLVAKEREIAKSIIYKEYHKGK